MKTRDSASTPRSRRGFAVMEANKQRELASKGGRAAHAEGRAHEFTREEAKSAGRKGGLSVSRDRAHMVEIGRAGGIARARSLEAKRTRMARVEKEEAAQ